MTSVTIRISRNASVALPPLWKIKSDGELGIIRAIDGVPALLPSVHQLSPNHYTPLTRAWQLFWWKQNPLMSTEKMTAVLKNNVCYTNGQGFGIEGDPRQNWILNEDIERKQDGTYINGLPKMEALVLGGNVVTGTPDGDKFWPLTLDGTKAPPAGITYQSHPWLIHAGVLSKYSTVTRTWSYRSFLQGDGNTVYAPFLASRPVWIDMAKLERVSVVPNPFRQN